MTRLPSIQTATLLAAPPLQLRKATVDCPPELDTRTLGIPCSKSLCLTLAGLYGVIVFSVAQRTLEIGLRMALGATSGTVVRSILTDGGTLGLTGITIGLILAVLVSRLLGGLLVGSRAADVGIFAAVATRLGLAALLSTYLPARRAARIDPVKALNEG